MPPGMWSWTKDIIPQQPDPKRFSCEGQRCESRHGHVSCFWMKDLGAWLCAACRKAWLAKSVAAEQARQTAATAPRPPDRI